MVRTLIRKKLKFTGMTMCVSRARSSFAKWKIQKKNARETKNKVKNTGKNLKI